MRKAILSFADGLLSREQMKIVRGGYGGTASCEATCQGTTNKVKCTGTNCVATDGCKGGCVSDTESKSCKCDIIT